MSDNVENIKKIKESLAACVSNDHAVALKARETLAAAITEPIRTAVMDGDTYSAVFKKVNLDGGSEIKFPVDFFRNENIDEYVAYVMPNQGNPAHRVIEGDYVTIPTYTIGNGIDIPWRFIRDSSFPVLEKAMNVIEVGHLKKKNDDAWATVIAAGIERNIVVNDSNASAGQFTPRLVSAMRIVMQRNGGGNSTSVNRGKLSHLFVSPEGFGDIRAWDSTILDPFTRREVFMAGDMALKDIYGTTMVSLDELGEGQAYQQLYTSLGGTMAGSDLEIVIGIDKRDDYSFVEVTRSPLSIYPDPTQHRNQYVSFYSLEECGYGQLDVSKVLIGSF